MPVHDSTTVAMPQDLLRIANLDAAQLTYLLDLASSMKALPAPWYDAFRGRSVACYFAKPSTRTRVSFEAAAQRLGLLPIMLRPDELQLGRGEPISDTARVLAGYAAAIVIRSFGQLEVEAVAGASSVPVINALTDDHHPCQALADLLTLREHFGSLEGLKLAYIGDGNNVAHSLMEAGSLSGMTVVLACPPDYQPDAEITREAIERSAEFGSSIELTTDPVAAVERAHAVYTDVWVSMGEDAEREERLARLAPYQVSESLMARARSDAVFMHCLPAHRGEEVAAAVIDGPKSVVFPQAANRMPTEQALLYALINRGIEAVV